MRIRKKERSIDLSKLFKKGIGPCPSAKDLFLYVSNGKTDPIFEHHFKYCSLCKKEIELIKSNLSIVDKPEKMNGIDKLSMLNEDYVCIVTARILSEMFPNEAPSVDELRLNFRIGLAENSLLIFDLETPEAEGEGLGGYLDEWTTTIILNLVSAIFYEISPHGIKIMQDFETWKNLKEKLVSAGGKAKFLIESKIEDVRKAILEVLSSLED